MSFQLRIKNAISKVNNNFLGTTLPIIQAAIAGVQDSALATTVSNLGGLGRPSLMIYPKELRAELTKLLEAKL